MPEGSRISAAATVCRRVWRRVRVATPSSRALCSSLPRGVGACSTSREPFFAGSEASEAPRDA